MDAVMASLVAIFAERNTKLVRTLSTRRTPLKDMVGVTWTFSATHGARQLLDSFNMLFHSPNPSRIESTIQCASFPKCFHRNGPACSPRKKAMTFR